MPLHTRSLHAVHVIHLPYVGGSVQLLCAKDAKEEAWPMEVVLHCYECMSDQDQHSMHVLLECTVRHHCNDTQLASPSATCVDYCMHREVYT